MVGHMFFPFNIRQYEKYAKFANYTKYTRFQNNLYNMQCLAFKQIQICFDFGHGHEDLKYNNYYATFKKMQICKICKNAKYAKFAKYAEYAKYAKHKWCFFKLDLLLKVPSTKKLIKEKLGVSRTIYVNVDSPNLGFP